MRLAGIDVSNWQGEIDWLSVSRDKQFAMMKVTEGVSYADPYFVANWTKAKRFGMFRGAYHFSRPLQNGPISEADWLLANIAEHLDTGDVVALDFEPTEPPFDGGLWTVTFMAHVRDVLGFRPMLYTAPYWIESYGLKNAAELAQYPLWLAWWRPDNMWPSAPTPWTDVALWQSSSEGTQKGVSGNVDLDFLNPAVMFGALGKPGDPVITPESNEQRLINLLGYASGDVARAIEGALKGAQDAVNTLKGLK